MIIKASGLIAAILAAIFLFFLAGFREPTHILDGPNSVLVLALMTAGFYLLAWLVAKSKLLRPRLPLFELLRLVLVAVFVTQPILLVLLLLDVDISRIVVVVELVALFFMLLLTAWRIPALLQLCVNAVAVLAISPSIIPSGDNSEPSAGGSRGEEQFISTSYHDLSLQPYRFGPDSTTNGGAIHRLDDRRLLLVDGSSAAKLLAFQGAKLSLINDIELNIPMNKASYLESNGPRDFYFRVTDIITVSHQGQLSLLVTHSYWDDTNRCFTIRLSEASWDTRSGIDAQDWTTRYESQPCVELPSYTNEHGGRMALLNEQQLLFSVGNHMLELYQPNTLIESDYGRIFTLDLDSWEIREFSRGHRNAQGLIVSKGLIWSTEHGPFGGDELNLVEEGKNYGWPLASYGTDYSGKTFKLGKLGDHSGYQRPIYSWTPSIGISSLIQLDSPLFPAWQDDLLIGSLPGLGNGLSLYRVRVREGRVVSNERIYLGQLVRDLVELPEGQLALWDGSATVTIVDAASQVIAQCTGCHATRYGVNGIGPTLYQIVGSKVARNKSFQYSHSLRDYGGVWSEARLNQFLKDPAGTVPGTIMQHGGVKDDKARRAIIDYLRQAVD
jgi:aldose sugar dehydrogenase